VNKVFLFSLDLSLCQGVVLDFIQGGFFGILAFFSFYYGGYHG
jgi:hypothetical protein